MSELDIILQTKIEKTLDIICPLYKEKLITEAYIVGSVAKGTATKESDIDIIIINPILPRAADLPPLPIVLPYSPSKEEDKIESLRLTITGVLENIGVKFKEISIKEFPLWYQFYKGEIFHIMTRPNTKDIDMKESINMTRDLCD